MKKFILILILGFFPLSLYSLDLNLSIPCDNGSLTITGTYDVVSGYTDVILQFNNCKRVDDEDSIQINGSASIKGQLQSPGTINLTLSFNNIDIIQSSASEDTTQTCSGQFVIQGSSQDSNKVNLNTQSSYSCSGSGNVNINFNEFINSLIFLDIF